MARIDRKLRKIFGSSASNNGQFGSGQAGTKILSNDPDVLQALPAYDQGWTAATIGARMFPALEEMQSQGYMDSRDIAYFYQEGIPEYNAATTYYQNSIVKKAGTYELYGSVIDNNLGNALPVGVTNANWRFLTNFSLANNTPPYGVTTNSGNDYSVTTSPTVTTFPNGLLLLVKFNAANTGAARLNANATTFINLLVNGAAMVGGEIKANTVYPVIYDGTNLHLSGANPIYATNAQTIAGTLADRAVTPASLAALTSTETRSGLVELATSAETIAGLDTTRAIHPAGFLSAFSTQFGANGYIKLPSGLIMQWGATAAFGASTVVTFPIAFPSACYHVSAIGGVLVGSEANAILAVTAMNAANATLRQVLGNGNPASSAAMWFAIGA